MGWGIVIETESRVLVRKWKEARRIREEGEKVINWNSGCAISEEWDEILKREERKKNKFVN